LRSTTFAGAIAPRIGSNCTGCRSRYRTLGLPCRPLTYEGTRRCTGNRSVGSPLWGLFNLPVTAHSRFQPRFRFLGLRPFGLLQLALPFPVPSRLMFCFPCCLLLRCLHRSTIRTCHL